MPGAGTTLAQLDRETGRFHAEGDQLWRHLLHSPDATREDYVRQLEITYGFEAPFEAACAYTPGLSQVIDLRGRARSGLIAQDLLTLGGTPEQIATLHTHDVEPFQDAAEALGWMYVVERPVLIHEGVRNALVTRFFDLGRATTYLTAYERQTSRRWAELGTALDRISSTEHVRARVLEAATSAFRALVQWQRSHASTLRSVGYGS